MYTKYRSPLVLVYCPEDHEDYETIKRELFRARHEIPLNMLTEEGDTPKLKDNLVFVLSTTPSLIPLLKLKQSSTPVCIAVLPAEKWENEINLLEDDRFLSNLQKVDDVPLADFLDKVQHPPADILDQPGDDESE